MADWGPGRMGEQERFPVGLTGVHFPCLQPRDTTLVARERIMDDQ